MSVDLDNNRGDSPLTPLHLIQSRSFTETPNSVGTRRKMDGLASVLQTLRQKVQETNTILAKKEQQRKEDARHYKRTIEALKQELKNAKEVLSDLSRNSPPSPGNKTVRELAEITTLRTQITLKQVELDMERQKVTELRHKVESIPRTKSELSTSRVKKEVVDTHMAAVKAELEASKGREKNLRDQLAQSQREIDSLKESVRDIQMEHENVQENETYQMSGRPDETSKLQKDLVVSQLKLRSVEQALEEKVKVLNAVVAQLRVAEKERDRDRMMYEDRAEDFEIPSYEPSRLAMVEKELQEAKLQLEIERTKRSEDLSALAETHRLLRTLKMESLSKRSDRELLSKLIEENLNATRAEYMSQTQESAIAEAYKRDTNASIETMRSDAQERRTLQLRVSRLEGALRTAMSNKGTPAAVDDVDLGESTPGLNQGIRVLYEDPHDLSIPASPLVTAPRTNSSSLFPQPVEQSKSSVKSFIYISVRLLAVCMFLIVIFMLLFPPAAGWSWSEMWSGRGVWWGQGGLYEWLGQWWWGEHDLWMPPPPCGGDDGGGLIQ